MSKRYEVCPVCEQMTYNVNKRWYEAPNPDKGGVGCNYEEFMCDSCYELLLEQDDTFER